jgi:hypothetical protein
MVDMTRDTGAEYNKEIEIVTGLSSSKATGESVKSVEEGEGTVVLSASLPAKVLLNAQLLSFLFLFSCYWYYCCHKQRLKYRAECQRCSAFGSIVTHRNPEP